MTAATRPAPQGLPARLRLGAVVLCLSVAATSTGCGASVPPPRAGAQAAEEADWRMDLGLEFLAKKNYDKAAATFYGVFSALPESDLRRDVAAFHLARSLVELGFVQAGAEHYFEIVAGRRVPEFVDKAIVELKPLYESGQIDRDRLVEGVLYGNQYSELSAQVGDFVEYLQALTEIRHGFVEWGHTRMEALAKAKKPYSHYARYTLAVERMAHHEDPAATKDLEAIARSADVPTELRDKARLALARIAYENKKYDEAWRLFAGMRSPIRLEDTVILEKAWDLVAKDDEQRALGFIVGLGAPVYRRIFAPDRDLIRALALRRLCQYRAAHLAVREFRAAYGPILAGVRDGKAPVDDPAVRAWAVEGDALLADAWHLYASLTAEKEAAGSISDAPLRAHVTSIYDSQAERVRGTVARHMDTSTKGVVDELLRVEQQINIIDYEVGVGIFKSGTTASPTATLRPEDIPEVSSSVYFHFDGEYWSDELNDYTVLADNRCMR
jgi:hypothetical protein